MVEHHSGPFRLEDPRPGITFAVDLVEPASKRCNVADAGTVLTQRLERMVIAADAGAEHLLAREDSIRWGGSEGNALAAAVHLAFSEHRPLVLSPDVVWLTLAQGVAHHVRLHAEHFRERLVGFQGKQTVKIVRGTHSSSLGLGDWAEVIGELATSVASRTHVEELPPMLCTFSTTTAASRVASQIVLLEGLRRFFDYELQCICGFPQITLLGTPSDWKDILGRTAAIEALGLGWWTERLRPVLEQLVATASESPDVAFWRDMYKLTEAYGPEHINGWFGLLFPYTRVDGGLPTVRNPMLTGERSVLASTELPDGICRVPLVVEDQGSTQRVELVAGLTGVAQDPSTLALTPVVGWAVTEASGIQRAIEAIKDDPRHRTSQRCNDVVWAELGGVPAGLIELYDDFERIELFVDDPASTVVLHTPLAASEAAPDDEEVVVTSGIDFGKGPGAQALCLVGLEQGFGVGMRGGRGEVSVIASSLEAFLERVLEEGAYFARPDFQPLRTLVDDE